jgi:hypothetical protein
MALKNAFENLSVEETQQAILILLAQIADKLPRLDTADRVVVQASESTTPVTISSGTVTTVTGVTGVTTVSAVTAVNSVQAFGTVARSAEFVPHNIAQMGALHLYNQLEVA